MRAPLHFVAIVPLCLGCSDLFHSTADFRTACETDGSACDSLAPQSICSLDRAKAEAASRHACAWLGACETPLGKQRYAECYTAALTAFDCTIAPDFRPQGEMLAYWTCLANSRSCTGVRACVLPEPLGTCNDNGTYVRCGVGKNARALLECTGVGAKVHAATCLAWGQTCAEGSFPGANAECASSSTPGACTETRCSGTRVIRCANNRDEGIDCAFVGAGACVPSTFGNNYTWTGCQSTGRACMATDIVACEGAVAIGCPASKELRVDCGALGSACTPLRLAQTTDVGLACVAPSSCASDQCDGNRMTSCNAGVTRELDCKAEGLGSCEMRQTSSGSNAACAAPLSN